MKLKRKLVLWILCIVFILSSCCSSVIPEENLTGKTDVTETAENQTSSNAPNPYEKILEKRINKDFSGQKFRIATDNKELILANNGESLLGKQHYLRNSAIEEKYNIQITLTEESGLPTVTDRIKTEALSGNDYCDLILLESTSFQTLAASDLLINVRSVPYLDINADFYFEKSLDATTLGSITYGIAGDFVYKPEMANAVFFNKTLLSQAPLPDLYSLVENNQWDIENFLLYSEEIYSLAKENGTKISGILSANSVQNLVNAFWAASGMDFFKNEYGTRPELIYLNENSERFITQIGNILFRSETFSSSNTQQGAISSFSNGESLFIVAPLSAASQFSGRGVDWGVVPLPKFDINQPHYYSYTDQSYVLAGFSKGSADLNFSGIVASALFATSKDLNQTYAIQAFLNLYFSSPKDAEMMKRIINTPYYDPVEFFGQIDASYTAATQTILYRSASNGTNFNALYKQYEKMLNKYLDTIFTER